MKQIVKKTATEFQYPEGSVFKKELNTQNFWSFELGSRDIDVPIRIYLVFQQNDRQHDQNLNNDTLCRVPVTSAHCYSGTKRYPDSGIFIL